MSDGSTRQRGSVLIIVLWVAFGLVALALYFAHAMTFELRAADNRAAGVEAEQAIEGAARYVSNVLATAQEQGVLPDLQTYQSEAVPVGDAAFWLIGRGSSQNTLNTPVFGLVDEASKLHLNNANSNMLQMLPGMTAELAAAILDWRDTDDEVTTGGAESTTYLRQNPAYQCKNSDFEFPEELRLVFGVTTELLYGEDMNLNGVLDMNENDAELSPPSDNRDGRLDPGWLEYVTVFTRQSAQGTNVNSQLELGLLLQQILGASRGNQILAQANRTNFTSLLEFYIASELTREEFVKIEGYLRVGANPAPGLVNVNTASEAVLACIPGIGVDQASALVAYRQANPGQLNSVAWVKEVLDQNNAITAGRYLTGRTYQFSADIAAVGRHGRGYRRVRFVFDTSNGTPVILYRRDLTHLGWALGREVRDALLLAKELQ